MNNDQVNQALLVFARTGSPADVSRELSIDYQKAYRWYKKYKKDWDQARAEYIENLKDEAATPNQVQKLVGYLTDILEKINDVAKENDDVNALAQITYATAGASRELTRLTAILEQNEKWEDIRDNAIVKWLMSDPDIKPLLLKKRTALMAYLGEQKKNARA